VTSENVTLTKALWPPFPRPYWPQCQCSGVCKTDGFRRLRCPACGQLAERALPEKLKVGEEACAQYERPYTASSMITCGDAKRWARGASGGASLSWRAAGVALFFRSRR